MKNNSIAELTGKIQHIEFRIRANKTGSGSKSGMTLSQLKSLRDELIKQRTEIRQSVIDAGRKKRNQKNDDNGTI